MSTKVLTLNFGPHAFEWGPKFKVKTLVAPHSRQEQLKKLKMPPFILIKADKKNKVQVVQNGNSPLNFQYQVHCLVGAAASVGNEAGGR